MPNEEKPFVVRDKRSSTSSESEETVSENEDLKEKPSEVSPENSDKSSEEQKLPPINFSTFVLSLSSSAAMSMGGYQDPVSGHMPKNLELAKQSIDILAILQDKTKGNLTEDEQKLIDSALYELRMQYVEEVKKEGNG